MIDVSVIIVSYNTCADTLRAIESVYKHTKRSVEVIVVDNNSSDNSVKEIKKKFPKVLLLAQKENGGFSKANNIGAKEAKGSYLLFLSSDALLSAHALNMLIETLEKDSSVGACSGMLLNSDGSIQPQGGALPTLLNICLWMFFIDDIPIITTLFISYQQRALEFFQKKRTTGWIGGTALCIEKDFFNAIGGWDEKIFLYGEDTELCLRIHNEKKRIMIVPAAKITHLQNKSTGSSKSALVGEILGLVYIFKKHKSKTSVAMLQWILRIGIWLRIILFGILLQDNERKRAYVEAYKRLTLA